MHWWKPGETLKTCQNLIDLMNSIMYPIVYDEDMNIMSGDLLKAFGAEKAMKLPMIAEEYTVLPEYDPVALTQISNTYAAGLLTKSALEYTVQDPLSNTFCTQDIYQQVDGTIQYNPVVETTAASAIHNKVLVNIEKVSPDPADTMEATRLVAMPLFMKNQTGHIMCDHVLQGAEMCVGFSVMHYGQLSDGTWSPVYINVPGLGAVFTNYIRLDETTTPTAFYSTIQNMCLVSSFDYHPRLVPVLGKTTLGAADDKETVNSTFGDVQTFTLIDRVTLATMNSVAMMGLFSVPLMGVWSNKG